MALSSICPKGQNGLVKNWIKMNKDEYSKIPVDVKSQTTKSKLAVGNRNHQKNAWPVAQQFHLWAFALNRDWRTELRYEDGHHFVL